MALSGPVNSMEKDKTECTGGTVVFGNREETDNLFSYHDQYDTVITMKKRAPAAVPVTAPAEIAPAPTPEEKITEGIEKTFTWKTDSAVIDVWDGGNVDGDRVTVLFNGRPLLTNYYLVKEKRQLRVRLSGNAVDTVTIVAINEGSDPPNTASLLFTDGPVQYGVLAYNKTGRKAVIKLKRAGR
jgi:hypothetical protein